MLEYDAIPGGNFVYRSMADGCAELLFHYKGHFDEVQKNGTCKKSFQSGIHGQTKLIRRFTINQDFGIFGVYLYPYAIPALFNISASDVSDELPDLHSFLGTEGKELEEKIMSSRTNNERLRLLSSFLFSKLAKKKVAYPRLHSCVKTILQLNGKVNIEKIASDACLSTRQFERRFKELAGFSPKLYSRITRFQAIFNSLNSDHVNLSQIAYQFGYYDQSHFVKDFREFSGYNPSEFLSGTTDTTYRSE